MTYSRHSYFPYNFVSIFCINWHPQSVFLLSKHRTLENILSWQIQPCTDPWVLFLLHVFLTLMILSLCLTQQCYCLLTHSSIHLLNKLPLALCFDLLLLSELWVFSVAKWSVQFSILNGFHENTRDWDCEDFARNAELSVAFCRNVI